MFVCGWGIFVFLIKSILGVFVVFILICCIYFFVFFFNFFFNLFSVFFCIKCCNCGRSCIIRCNCWMSIKFNLFCFLWCVCLNWVRLLLIVVKFVFNFVGECLFFVICLIMVVIFCLCEKKIVEKFICWFSIGLVMW